MSSLAPEESRAVYHKDKSVTEYQTVRMGSKSWTVPAVEILNLLAGMELALTLGGNAMDGLTVEINQMKMFANVEGVGWASFGVAVEMSVCQRGEGATGGQTVGMVAMKLAVHLQMG